jgi:hypothetical protein
MERPIEYHTTTTPSRLPPLERSQPSPDPWNRSVNLVEQYIGRNPALAMGIALALGVVLGWLIKRR